MAELFSGRHVVITGGDGALGEAVVRAFVAEGATCHLPLYGPAKGAPAAGTIELGGVDLTDEGAVTRCYAALPPIWASIHLAGGFRMAPITDASLADLEQQFRINVATTWLCCREAIRSMRKSGGGRIVNVAARVAESPAANLSAYSAAKGGVAALTRALATEVARDRILVNAVLPSIIDSPANRKGMPEADHRHWPKPEELAEAIAWLASPRNTLTSGALVPVYGRA